MFSELHKNWQKAFDLAWHAYKNGTIPIGALIVNAQGEVVATGQNRIFDEQSAHPLAGTFMAHAEMIAMMGLNEREHPDIRTYSLYTTMEPCPMCFGTMLMMHIQDMKYASRDAFAGASALKDTIPYIKNKKMTITRGSKEMEAFQIAIQAEYELSRNRTFTQTIFSDWEKDCPEGVKIGKDLFDENYLKKAIHNESTVETIYNEIQSRYIIEKK